MKLRPAAAFVCSATLMMGQSPSGNQAPDQLEVEPLKTSITVHGRIESAAPAYISSLSADSLESRPGVNLDDRLRDIPGFTLFRRSSSLVAHPTTQGISLRGIGSSAAGTHAGTLRRPPGERSLRRLGVLVAV